MKAQIIETTKTEYKEKLSFNNITTHVHDPNRYRLRQYTANK